MNSRHQVNKEFGRELQSNFQTWIFFKKLEQQKDLWSMLEQEFGGSKIPNFARFYDPFKIFYSADFITVRITA